MSQPHDPADVPTVEDSEPSHSPFIRRTLIRARRTRTSAPMHLTTQRRSDSTEAATPRTATLGRSTRSLIAAAVVLTGAALTACAPTPPSTQPASNPATTTASADPVPSSGDGYELTGWAPPTAFVLRIHPSAAAFSSDVAAAAAEVTRLSGITITMGAFASSPQPDLSGTAAEIVVTTGTYCGLGPSGAPRCGDSRPRPRAVHPSFGTHESPSPRSSSQMRAFAERRCCTSSATPSAWVTMPIGSSVGNRS